MKIGKLWIELRSTAPNVLEDFEGFVPEPPADAEKEEGLFSIVIKDQSTKVRQLPSLYFGSSLISSEREVERLQRDLGKILGFVRNAENVPTFMMQACKYDNRIGLYSRDLCRRTSLRVRLQRLGLAFSNDPWVTLTPEGNFQTTDWGRFRPEFQIAFSAKGEDDPLEEVKGARVSFLMATYRLGLIPATELHHLVNLVTSIRTFAGGDAQALTKAIAAS
jgi:hypothetical protein